MTGYPWSTGDQLFAADLNAAIANAGRNGTGGGASITVGPTPPANPLPGAGWWDSIGGNLYISFQDVDSTQWVIANNYISGVLVGTTPPVNPVQGMEWFDAVGGNLYIWFQDVDSGQWIIANNNSVFVTLSLTGLTNAANDTAAASAGVAINQVYRNGSQLMIRVT